MASNAMQVLYSTIDMIIVGEFVGTPGLSAVSQSSQIVNFATMVCLGFSNAGQVLIAQALGVPESVIALTFVALGTSLPELVTAVTSLVKGHSALSLGNIIGANLFNLVLVAGLSVTLSPFAVPASKTIAGMNASLVVDIPLMFFVMAFMTLPAIFRGKLQRWQGITLLCVYAAYIGFQFFG